VREVRPGLDEDEVAVIEGSGCFVIFGVLECLFGEFGVEIFQLLGAFEAKNFESLERSSGIENCDSRGAVFVLGKLFAVWSREELADGL